MEHSSPSGVIDATKWSAIRDMIMAAHVADISSFYSKSLHLNDLVKAEQVDEKAGLYVVFLLWQRVMDVHGGRVKSGDFHGIAERMHGKISNVLKVNLSDVENVIRTVFKRADKGNQITGARLIIIGTATLGALFEDLPNELDALYPSLAQWYEETFPTS